MSLQHVALEIAPADAPGAVAFWDLLGFTEVMAPAGLAGRVTWLAADDLQIHLLHTEDPVVAPSGHVAVVCPDYDEVQAALGAAGFPVRDHTPYWDAPRCMTRAPGGHLVEVMAAPPA